MIFLLGGHDLEMEEIKKMLKGSKVEDNDLQWDNAPLSSYASVFNDENVFVGIELKQDCPLPKHYREIDHHNDKKDLHSSIEQVAELLGFSLNRDQLLAAANDKGYIPALEAMGATEEEIKKVRYEDKKAQGVTKEDERLADESIQSHSFKIGKVTVVESLTPRFSTITDKLYPFDELFIRHQQSFTYYGKKSTELGEKYQSQIKENKAYTGGANPGYFGLDAVKCAKEEASWINSEIIDYIKALEAKSYHIFMFPFRWEKPENPKEKNFTNKLTWENIDSKKDKQSGSNKEDVWVQASSSGKKDKAVEQYNERNYFYEFIHPLIYNTPKLIWGIKHYERTETHDRQLCYEIKVRGIDQPFTLSIEKLSLDFFSTGTGILSFHLINTQYSHFSDIKKINHFGRRIFPPFIDKISGVEQPKNFNEIADEIKITGLDGDPVRYREDFSEFGVSKFWQPARFIKNLLFDFRENLYPQPVIDDRMFTMCWAINDGHAEISKSPQEYEKYLRSDAWHEFIFIDSGDSTCQNRRMQEKLLKQHTYPRWQKYGTLFGVTRYSFMVLTADNSFSRNVLLTHFRTLYEKMVMLTLLQRASILRFSSDIATFGDEFDSNNLIEKFTTVDKLYKGYVQYINRIYHHEISAQEQGIELYDMLQKSLRIERHAKEIKKEIREFFNYINLKKTEQINKSTRRLSILAALIVVPTFLFNLLNNRFFKELPALDSIQWIGFYKDSVLLLITIVLLSGFSAIGFYNLDKTIYLKKNQKTYFKIKGKYLVYFSAILLLLYILSFQFFIEK